VLFDRFTVGGCNSNRCLVLILCIVEFCLKASVFLTANVDNANMYWEWSGRMFNYLNTGWKVSIYSKCLYTASVYIQQVSI
jgi:hypothetical protein